VPVREIRVVTTRAGAQRVRDQLLDPGTGHFRRFCRDFGIPEKRIRFDPSCILVPKGADGKALEDVRTPADNARVADCIVGLVRELTRNPDTALHCSVAGGRKTMGIFLGIAFELFARPQDRLSHVLVWPPEIEGQKEFFYPPSRSTSYTVDGKTVRSRDIRVELAEIPVLLLREKVRAAGLETLPYSDLVAEGQHELDRLAAPPPIRLDSRSRSLVIESSRIPLTSLEFGVYQLLARRRMQGCGRPSCESCSVCSLEAKHFLDAAVLDGLRADLAVLGVRDERARALSGWSTAGDQRFLQVRSRIERKLRELLGPGQWVSRYCILARRGPGTHARYHLPLSPEEIVLG
jgi:CRISPR-associated protein (TIGR02584 family)